MKRILCIFDSLNAGGAETFLMKIARTLPPDVCGFDFIVSHPGGDYAEEITARGGKIHLIPMRRKDLRGAFRGITTAVRENKYDTVLKFGNTPIAVVDLIAAKLGGARVLGMRSCNALTGISTKEKIINAVLRPLLNCICNVKIAPSMLAAEFTFGKKQAHKNVHLLNNGVDLGIFHYDEQGRVRVREEFGLTDKTVVGHIGRFHKQKNHEYLLKVFAEILRNQSNAVLLLVGAGALEESIRTQARELKIESNVIFAGTRTDIPDVLSAMDVFVFPSFYEGMPNTVIEAQATGLPCIIADTITKEADITGLVQYLPLSPSAKSWAQTAIDAVAHERRDTAADFLKHGYDIQSVAERFLEILSL